MNLKMINREAALDAIEDGKDVYIIRPVSLDSAVLLRDLLKLEFAIEEPEICRGTDVPEPPKEAGGVKKKMSGGARASKKKQAAGASIMSPMKKSV